MIKVYPPTQPNFVKGGGGGGGVVQKRKKWFVKIRDVICMRDGVGYKKEEVVCENQRRNLFERWGGL